MYNAAIFLPALTISFFKCCRAFVQKNTSTSAIKKIFTLLSRAKVTRNVQDLQPYGK